ncbi:uncharacterized protein LOC128963159 [Oppia nitens]|uniref:uncharacterized protein LOC128963159 n=1 Tax=Oppia nitens TaxID=1686743 RepID=UPI0023DBF121|nr:uncharacterized protein LOC128963159 [Oppia nitens]
MLFKSIILVAFMCLVRCDPGDDTKYPITSYKVEDILKVQGEVIKDTVGWLLKTKEETLGSVKILNYIHDHIKNMDNKMMNWAKGLKVKQGLNVAYDIFNYINRWVYDFGFHKAMAEILIISNKTEAPIAVAKFAVTSRVIDWRTDVDTKRREVEPTECADEQTLWNQWKHEIDETLETLDDLIPKLKSSKSNYWAKQHQRMRDFIGNNSPKIDSMVKGITDPAKRTKTLCILVEQIHLLNTVASSRPPAK